VSTAKLFLNGNQFDGTIPPQIGQLTLLQELYLHVNKLEGTIPNAFEYLEGLEILKLHDNKLGSLESCKKLIELVVQNNDLTGTVPTELGKLSALTRLTVEENQLSGSMPSEVCALGESNVLDLYVDADCAKDPPGRIECDCCEQCN
jgi:Leucine-rich repeat (LRR) protein